MDSPESTKRLLLKIADHPFFLAPYFGKSAVIKPKNYSVILKFVPCNGDFNPTSAKCLSKFKASYKLKPGSITSANWIKRPDR